MKTVTPQYDHLALTGGTIYIDPSHEPIRNGVVLIAGDKIAGAGTSEHVQIPPAAQVIDCAGCAITAGFWNSHVHFMERKWADAASIPAAEMTRQLQAMLSRYGFTSAFDLSSPWQNTKWIRDRIESGEVPGPRIYSTGVGLLPVNPGLPPEAIIRFMGWMNPATYEIANEVADADQAASAARKLLDLGVDGIKLFASAPSKAALSLETMRPQFVKRIGPGGRSLFIPTPERMFSRHYARVSTSLPIRLHTPARGMKHCLQS